MHKTRLLVRFGAVTFALLVILGSVVSNAVNRTIRDRTLQYYTQSVENMMVLMVGNLMTHEDFNGKPFTPAKAAILDSLLGDFTFLGAEQLTATLYNPDGVVIYATDPTLLGTKAKLTPAQKKALAGTTSSRFTNTPDIKAKGGQVIQYTLAIPFEGKIVGVAQADTPDYVITVQTERDLKKIQLILGGGMFLFWVALFPIAMTVARALRRQAAENEHLAMHDQLTGLPNRNLLKDRLEQAVAQSSRTGHQTGLLFIDLDRFKEVNDALGHQQGDILLGQIAARLAEAVRDADSVARLGGDEFAVVVPDVTEPAVLVALAERFTELLRVPFEINNITVNVDASIGVTIFPDHGTDADTLMQRADIAMYAAKEAGLDYTFYSAEHDSNSPVKLALAGELRRALDNDDELVMHFHPLVDVRTNAVTGVEALIRWNHPTRGFVLPDDFIPLAEQSGLIRPLTYKALDLSLAQCRAWADAGLHLRVAVNLSARNLREADLPERVANLLDRHQVDPQDLELEITESGLLSDPAYANMLLHQLADIGVHLALDDFGTGYSSLSYLKNLPVNQLKIDRSFVNNMSNDATDAMIVRSVIELAHNLGLDVTAEGVETADQLAHLRDLSCDTVQGYHLTKPLAAGLVPGWIAGHHHRNGVRELPQGAQHSFRSSQ